MTSTPLPPVESAKKKTLITICADTSGSMQTTGAIDGLNKAFAQWRPDLQAYPELMRVGEIALVTFGRMDERTGTDVLTVDPAGGDGAVTQPFVPIANFRPAPLRAAGGRTPLVRGLRLALEITERRRSELERQGISMACRPLIYLVTDGAPTDDEGNLTTEWRSLVPQLRRLDTDRKVVLFAFGVGAADMTVLQELAPGNARPVENTDFTQFLAFALHSMDVSTGAAAGSAGLTGKGIGDVADEMLKGQRELLEFLKEQTSGGH